MGWGSSSHNNWASGSGLLALEDATLAQPINTVLPSVEPTYYFETDFNFSGDPSTVTDLLLNHIVDDGAIFYLNGVEVGRFQADGVVNFSDLASGTVTNASPQTISIGAGSLVVGNNRLSVEVHQVSTGSTDIVFGAELIALTTSTPATPFLEDPEEWIELYNKSGSAVDLSNWQLDGGIRFDFAPGTTLAAGDYLVVSNDRAALSAKYPDITIAAGEFGGKLGNAGDQIQLVDAIGNLADEVNYLDGGQFDERADGGGASLELRDPNTDNSNGQAWAASDSGDDSQWQTVSYTAVAAQPDGTDQIWNEFVFGLLNDGEILIDNISVIFDPGGANIELIQNGAFDNGLSTWRAGGNHRYATIVADPNDPSNQVLQVRSTGSAEHILNHVETTLVDNTEVLVGETYQISYRAKWISGSNQLNTRLYFNYLPHTERIARPKTTGTPGAVNSAAESNIGPVYQNLQQSVVTPALEQYQITTNNGNSFSVNTDQVTLQGTGSYLISEMRIDGVAEALEVTWIDDTNWEVTVDLATVVNHLTIRAFDYSGVEIHSDAITVLASGNATVSSDNLRISEIHFNPAAASAAEIAAGFIDSDDFEFVEIYNPSTTGAINLNGVQLADGVTFDFGNVNLGAGERAVVVEDIDAFMARYGNSVNVLGQWTGGLSNSGENIALLDSSMNEIMSVNYGDNDPWHSAADGAGFSLVLEDPVDTPVDELGKYYSWRSSTEFGGTPGADATTRTGVVVNEVLAHTDLPQSDSIELFNTTGIAIHVGGWYLSDAGDDLLKYQIPVGTVIVAGGYLVFDESDFNVNSTGFALSGDEGDQVYLSQASSGVFVGLQDAVEFNATFNGESLGRLPNGSGRLTRLASTSLGSINGEAEVGPLVISEVNYHPESPSAAALAIDATLTDNDLEYIEVANPTSAAIDLTNWRIRGEADYDFAAGTTLAAGAAILVVSFDPADPLNASKLVAFETHYGIGAGVTIVGALSASLSNSSGRVSLQQPDTPDLLGVIPHVVIDEIVYDDLAPWPDADGTGQSLQRDDVNANGNDSTIWIAATPTPGVFESQFLLGDVNQDGMVDFLDISPFITLLQLGDFLDEADIDRDGDVDFLDISPFINLLSS